MPVINCDYCRESFYKKPSHIEKCIRNYCSDNCRYKGRKSGLHIKCFVCGKEVYKERRFLNRSKYKKFFCTRQCSNVWLGTKHRGKDNPNWTTGKSSYKAIMKRISTNIRCLLCSKSDERILLIHHLDKNRQNNDPKNLVWLCHNCHFLVHKYKQEQGSAN